MYRKLLAAGLSVSLAAISLTGCAGKVSAETVVATVNGDEISYGLLNFVVRYNQAQMQYWYGSYLGDTYWTSYGDTTKENNLESIETMIVMEQHMEDYGASIDEFADGIKEAAENFLADNDADTIAAMNVTQADVERAMELYTVQQVMYYEIIADVDTEVSDEEAAQKTVKYCYFSTAGTTTDDDGNTVDLTDEEIEEIKAQAEQVRQAVADGQDMDEALAEVDEDKTTTTSSYGADNGSLSDTLKEVAETLTEDGQVADELVEGENGYYVLQMVSVFDEEATDSYKEEIISDRESDLYDETTSGWLEEAKITTKSGLLKKIDFTDTWTLYESETETETTAADETDAESESAAESESETAAETASETETAAETESESVSETASETASETETESESESETASETESESETASETETE